MMAGVGGSVKTVVELEQRVTAISAELPHWDSHLSAPPRGREHEAFCFEIVIVIGISVMIAPIDHQKVFLILNESAVPHDRERDPAYLLPYCWRLQDCYSCLHSQYHCSWCAIVRALDAQYHDYR